MITRVVVTLGKYRLVEQKNDRTQYPKTDYVWEYSDSEDAMGQKTWYPVGINREEDLKTLMTNWIGANAK